MTTNSPENKPRYDDYDGFSPLTPVIAALVMFAVLLFGAVGIASTGFELERPVHRLQATPDIDREWQWQPKAHNFDHMYRRAR